ncbi:MAG: L,D-transpeptidase family protein [Rhodovibrionaceae bacterium]|nr:L,D-transpeptidase family protein [Rhodovibrionaceae bacterium]
MDLVVGRINGEWRAGPAGGRLRWRCAIGRSGVRSDKHEGDGATPIGRWPLRRVLYRADRIPPPVTALATAVIDPADGWCDDPSHPAYNRQVRLPFPASHERLWRDDRLYDIVAVLAHNDDPPKAGLGSAVFLHVAREDYRPTAGCVALAPDHLVDFLSQARPGDAVVVETPR